MYSIIRKASLLFVMTLVVSCTNSKERKEFDFTTSFEKSNGKKTATYEEIIEFYTELAEAHKAVKLYVLDETDSRKPLHLITYNTNRSFESEFSGDQTQNILFINNGIHPGESDGIDASMMLLRDLAEERIESPKNTIIAVIPVYNIGGALNRNSTSRTNQNGPESYGFRGNARNYDLNRDFIKADTKNAKAFTKAFRMVKPDFFIDNHVSNGADYQYTLTHLFTQHNKLGGALGDYLHTQLMPKLEDSLQQKSWDITPYVNVFNSVPESGFSQFYDSPRYSTGYATLYNTLGMMVETHMLKPYKQRVEGTYELMRSFINIVDQDAEIVNELRKNALTNYKPGDSYPINWAVDTTRSSTLKFKGYEAEKIPSKLTGAERLKYDRERPFTKEVMYSNYFTPTQEVTIPEKYIIPQGYWDIIELFKLNRIKLQRVKKDTTLQALVYYIDDFQTRNTPYEGHYSHYNTAVETRSEEVTVKKGDYMIDPQQEGLRYIVETLEPAAVDSFFNWNYFDTILQQKEGFSPYVWEDKAAQFLEENPKIKAAFEAKKKDEPDFAENWYAQLDWIHKQSPYYERAHLRYPIIRVGG